MTFYTSFGRLDERALVINARLDLLITALVLLRTALYEFHVASSLLGFVTQFVTLNATMYLKLNPANLNKIEVSKVGLENVCQHSNLYFSGQ